MPNGLMEDVRTFMALSREEKRAKTAEALDNRVRIITAGLSIRELRALLRGDAPTERPNPRYKVHVTSFIAHIRPKFYFKASTHFTHTFRLGYLSTLFFLVEIITGLVLMVYYVPFPTEAYESILTIESNVMFGELMRDLHRIGAELMVISVWLHLFRTYFTGSYKGKRSFTWMTGVFLLLTTVFLSFSGYLLPWDQLAYWAVTIGTSMADKAPLYGPESNLLLRGAPDIGVGGLLRFYLLHVILLPLVGILLLSIHYYKVAREHGISLPAIYEENVLPPVKIKEGKKRIDFIPDLLTHEIFLASLVTGLLLLYMVFFYAGAPLEHHANPLKTPLDTKSPWYFLWIQGMLKLGDPTLMGVVLPTIFVLVLLAIPYIDRNPSRLAKNRPFAIAWGIFWVIFMLVASYMGTPNFGIETPAAVRIVQDLAPEEGSGMLRAIPFDELEPGVYYVNESTTESMPKELAAFFEDYEQRVNDAEERGKMLDPTGLLYISEWQTDLRKVVMRMEWTDPETAKLKTYEHEFFLHRERRRGE
ncbi:MAG: cytochrome bc complex cytochrome b subunit [Anaerolineales bacterium]